MADEPRPASEAAEGGLTRRQFLQAAGATAVTAVAFTGCATDRREFIAQSRARLSEDTLWAFDNWYATTCQGCDAGCGAIVRVIEGRAKKVEGNPDHPVNRGKLCARGQASVQELYHPDRVQGPMRLSGPRGSGSYTPISWNEALTELVGKLRQGNTQNMTMVTKPLRAHPALVVDRFTRGLGATWMTLDPMGEAPLREAVRRLTGQEALPDFDIANARYIVSFGADFLGSWLSPVRYNLGYGAFRQGSYRAGQFQPKQSGSRGYLVHVGPNFNLTAANADEWIPCRPGTEGLVALSMAQVALSQGGGATNPLGNAASFDAYAPDRVTEETGVSADRIRRLAQEFASRQPSLAIGGGSAGAHTNGTENLMAILSLNMPNLGRPGGMRLNPVTAPIDGLPTTARANRLSDWQRLAEQLRGGQVPVVMFYDADPVHELPGAIGFADALRGTSAYVVSFSSFIDDTTVFADLILPSNVPLEEWSDDIPDPGPGFPVLSLQQPIVNPLYDTRSFADVLLAVGQELGGAVSNQLPWNTMKELLQTDFQTLQQQGGGSVRATAERYWTTALQQGGWWNESQTAATTGAPAGATLGPRRPPQYDGSEQQFPFYLVVYPQNTLRNGDAAHLPWMQATPDPITSVTWQSWVELNPKTAGDMGLREGDVVAVVSQHGRVEVPVYVHPAAPPTVVAMPLGQGHSQYGRWARGRGVNPMTLVAPVADEATGALAYGATRVRIEKTGRRVSLPKLEGTVPAVLSPDQTIIQITRGA